MRYKLTPLNIICAILIVYDIYLFIGYRSANEVMARAYLIPIILGGIIIDVVLQNMINKRIWLFVIEFIFVIAVVIINLLP
jgi:hypothetical protein